MNIQPIYSPAHRQRSLFFSYLVLAGLIAGSLDAMAAIFIISHGNASSIFKFIASGIFGRGAFEGGDGMVALGIALHYFIAMSFTIFYFVIYRYVGVLHKSILLSTMLYGLFIYVVMNIIVMSLSNIIIPHRNVVGVIKNVSILMVCVAFPVVYSRKLYRLKYEQPHPA